MKSFVICKKITLVRKSRRKRGFSLGNLKERDHLKDVGIDR
jgi:ribosomal protein L13E